MKKSFTQMRSKNMIVNHSLPPSFLLILRAYRVSSDHNVAIVDHLVKQVLTSKKYTDEHCISGE